MTRTVSPFLAGCRYDRRVNGATCPGAIVFAADNRLQIAIARADQQAHQRKDELRIVNRVGPVELERNLCHEKSRYQQKSKSNKR